MESPEKIELPSAFEDADVDHLVVLIADMLDRLIEHNDRIPLSPEALTRFHSRTPPSISVIDYLRRIVKYTNVERTCLLITLHYIDQICARFPRFTLSSLTCHRFIITAVVVASKALCDAFSTNTFYAKIGGIRVGELNLLEKELLSNLDWRLTSTKEVLDAYYVNLIRTHSQGRYILAGAHSTTSPETAYSDSDMDGTISPSPTSPVTATAGLVEMPQPDAAEPSTVLISRTSLPPMTSSGPTIEQNMAFAELRGTGSSSSASSSSSSSASSSLSTSTTTRDQMTSDPHPPIMTTNSVSSSSSISSSNKPETEIILDINNSNGPGHEHERIHDELNMENIRPRTRPRINSIN
ncbi:cyclin-domain-containing [Pyrrhoderma noxium]|uniref:Cyclin-domain-containing n=1 Tax=Pyrrhoderma noxium TaxID=2282107 RepID=A0A286UGA5_9AGAM|nr:cyclin-domain-containing [Pyrrhoderma noxium]